APHPGLVGVGRIVALEAYLGPVHGARIELWDDVLRALRRLEKHRDVRGALETVGLEPGRQSEVLAAQIAVEDRLADASRRRIDAHARVLVAHAGLPAVRERGVALDADALVGWHRVLPRRAVALEPGILNQIDVEGQGRGRLGALEHQRGVVED